MYSFPSNFRLSLLQKSASPHLTHPTPPTLKSPPSFAPSLPPSPKTPPGDACIAVQTSIAKGAWFIYCRPTFGRRRFGSLRLPPPPPAPPRKTPLAVQLSFYTKKMHTGRGVHRSVHLSGVADQMLASEVCNRFFSSFFFPVLFFPLKSQTPNPPLPLKIHIL